MNLFRLWRPKLVSCYFIIFVLIIPIIGWGENDEFVWGFVITSISGTLITSFVADPISLSRTTGFDRISTIFAGVFTVTAYIFAPIDFAYLHLSDVIPMLIRTFALLLFISSVAIKVWAMKTNKFFSPLIEIQEERGHYLVNKGPYALVRHPGNLANIFSVLCCPIILNSWIALVIATPAMILTVYRTAIEDRFLTENLRGYKKYKNQVRWRLIPAIY